MIKADIVSILQKKLNLSQYQAEEAVELTIETLKEGLKKDEKIELRGFGIFRVKRSKTGVGRNIKTGEIVPLKEGKTVKFKPSIRLKK